MGHKDKGKKKVGKRAEDQADHGHSVGNLADTSLVHLERLARLMRQRGHGHGLNPAQWEALRYLQRANRLSNTPGALARYQRPSWGDRRYGRTDHDGR